MAFFKVWKMRLPTVIKCDNNCFLSVQFAVIAALVAVASAMPQSRNPANLAEFERAQANGEVYNVSADQAKDNHLLFLMCHRLIAAQPRVQL